MQTCAFPEKIIEEILENDLDNLSCMYAYVNMYIYI